MQTVSANFLASAKSSSTPVFHAYLYRDGNLLYELPLEDGEVSYDLSQDVQGEASLTVLDASGTLTPENMWSDLTPFGAEINITAGFKLGNTEEVVSLGWFVIQDMEIDESLTWYADYRYVGSSDRRSLVNRGTKLNLKLRDRSQKLIDYKFLAIERTREDLVWPEVVRLVKGVVPTTDPGLPDQSSGYTLSYGDERWEAIKSVAANSAAEPIMLPDGSLTLRLVDPPVTSANLAPDIDWKINLTEYKKSLSRDDVYNIVVVRSGPLIEDLSPDGLGDTGQENIAYATIDTGPTAWNGPFGPRPVFYDVTRIDYRSQLEAFAKAKLATIAVANSQTMPVTALPNYAVELGDYVDFYPPESDRISGDTRPRTSFRGRIVKLTHSAHGEMKAELAMPAGWIF